MNNIRLLDCTLRDGGHLNEGKFGEDVIKNVIKKLVEARVDIIEVGFLWNVLCDKDTARYLTIADVKRILPDNLRKSKISLMADFINLDDLEEYDGTVEYIRLSFKRSRISWACDTLKVLKKKGYKCFINPVNCNVYSDDEYLKVLHTFDQLKPYGFSIVDTFGVLRLQDLSSKYYLAENNLSKDIVIGVHLHENLGLAYSLAQHFINIHSPKRHIVIDGSLLGMGRVPGNLCIEQIMDYLNVNYNTEYQLNEIYDAIDDYIEPLKKKTPWGYSLPYALSAQNKVHRTYSEYLIEKWKLKTSDIQNILSKIADDKVELFDEKYIEQLYREYLCTPDCSTTDIIYLKKLLIGKDILILAPGKSIDYNMKKIKRYVNDNTVVISVNFMPKFLKLDYCFFTNIKRLEKIGLDVSEYRPQIIATSNLVRYSPKIDFLVSYKNLAYHDGDYCEDSVLMLINLLNKIEIKKIMVAGFDGFKRNSSNLYSEIMEREEKGEYKNKHVMMLLRRKYSDMELTFVTDSIYDNNSTCVICREKNEL